MSNDETFLSISYVNKDGTDYKIGVTRKKANKRTGIYCENNHVKWRQMYPLGISGTSKENIICQPSAFIEKGIICVLVIAGKPGGIAGLEEGVFLSSQSWNNLSFDKIYVMSEKAFSKLNFGSVKLK